jgi:hypothetical protein
MLRSACVILSAFLVWSGSALAGEPYEKELRYQIEHELFGEIGEETLKIRQEADRVVIDRTVNVTVRFMLATLYQRRARYIEIWQDDRLIRFEGNTLDDGEQSDLIATLRTGEAIAIETAGNLIDVPVSAIPTDPWHQNIVDRQLLFDRLDGRLMDVVVTDRGLEQLRIDDRLVEARKFTISGQRHQELWFETSSGLWLKSTIKHASGDIHITRQALPKMHLARGFADDAEPHTQLVRPH